MNGLTPDEVKSFIRQFRNATFPQRFARLRSGYEGALLESRKTAPQFNVFQVLGVGRREVNTHSAFLADLLNPAGTHAHGNLFLNAFLQHCRKNVSSIHGHKFPDVPDKITPDHWHVRKERGTNEYGRMDIVIQCRELKFLYVIENKVSHHPGKGEGEQLGAYWHWMQKDCADPAGRALLFLTPDRRIATTDSAIDYFTIDYANNIYNWLTTVLPKVESPLVETIIRQYRRLILTL